MRAAATGKWVRGSSDAAARAGIRRLSYGGVPNPTAFTDVFGVLPLSYRPSLLAAAAAHPEQLPMSALLAPLMECDPARALEAAPTTAAAGGAAAGGGASSEVPPLAVGLRLVDILPERGGGGGMRGFATACSCARCSRGGARADPARQSLLQCYVRWCVCARGGLRGWGSRVSCVAVPVCRAHSDVVHGVPSPDNAHRAMVVARRVRVSVVHAERAAGATARTTAAREWQRTLCVQRARR